MPKKTVSKKNQINTRQKKFVFDNKYNPLLSKSTNGFFYIRARKNSLKWNLTFECRINKKISQTAVDRAMYRDFGLDEHTTIEQAKQIIKQYNQMRKKYLFMSAQQIRTFRRLRDIKINEKNFVNAELAENFRTKTLSDTFGSYNHKVRLDRTIDVVFDMLKITKVMPYQYNEKSSLLISYFISKQYSVSYCLDILSVLNKWGLYLSKNTGVRFEPFGRLHPIAKNQIRQAQELKGRTVRRTSKPLTPDILDRVHRRVLRISDNELRDEGIKKFNYLKLCFAFALRPKEADDFIRDPANYVKTDSKGIKFLEIEQTKLAGLSREERIKRVPFVNQYQLEVEKFFNDKENNFIRPEAKWVDAFCKEYKKQRPITEVYSNYAPRKGYVGEAKKTQSLLSIAKQMGHQSPTTTYKSYSEKSVPFYDENKITQHLKNQKKIKSSKNIVSLAKRRNQSQSKNKKVS